MTTTQQETSAPDADLERAFDALINELMARSLGLTQKQRAALKEAQAAEKGDGLSTNAKRTADIIRDFGAGGRFGTIFDNDEGAKAAFAALYALSPVEMMTLAAHLMTASKTLDVLSTHLLRKGVANADPDALPIR